MVEVVIPGGDDTGNEVEFHALVMMTTALVTVVTLAVGRVLAIITGMVTEMAVAVVTVSYVVGKRLCMEGNTHVTSEFNDFARLI